MNDRHFATQPLIGFGKRKVIQSVFYHDPRRSRGPEKVSVVGKSFLHLRSSQHSQPLFISSDPKVTGLKLREFQRLKTYRQRQVIENSGHAGLVLSRLCEVHLRNDLVGSPRASGQVSPSGACSNCLFQVSWFLSLTLKSLRLWSEVFSCRALWAVSSSYLRTKCGKVRATCSDSLGSASRIHARLAVPFEAEHANIIPKRDWLPSYAIYHAGA